MIQIGPKLGNRKDWKELFCDVGNYFSEGQDFLTEWEQKNRQKTSFVWEIAARPNIVEGIYWGTRFDLSSWSIDNLDDDENWTFGLNYYDKDRKRIKKQIPVNSWLADPSIIIGRIFSVIFDPSVNYYCSYEKCGPCGGYYKLYGRGTCVDCSEPGRNWTYFFLAFDTAYSVAITFIEKEP